MLPTIESLEVRLTPATSTWSGAVSALWSDNGNWDTPPAAGNDLVFPSSATNTTNTNDLTAGTSFASVTVKASGYTISGNAIALTGTIDASQASGSSAFNLPVNLAASTTVVVDNAGGVLSLGGVIDGAAGLTKSGPGSLSLTATNTFTGTTAVSAGTLVVNGSLTASAVTLASGTHLSGTGTVDGIATTAATVGPGQGGPGILTDAGPLTLDSGSTFAVVLNGAAPGSGYSQLGVAGAINLGGATLGTSLGFTPTVNETFTIINNTGSSAVTGTFNGLAEGATVTVSGTKFKISYVGGDGNDVVLTELVNTTTTVTGPTAAVGLNQSTTLTATVASTGSGTPTGTVQFLDGSTPIGTGTLSGGVATLNTSFASLGSHSITATYQGNSGFATSTSSAVSVSVEDASATSLLVAPTSTTYGMTVTLTATVTASTGTGTPTGTVQFFAGSTSLGTAPLSAGVAAFPTSAIPVSATSVTAKYLGDATFAGSSGAGSVTIAQASTTTALQTDKTTAVYGQAVSLKATVTSSTGTPTGTVQFFAGSTSLGTAPLSAGVATLGATTIPVGVESITATYVSDGNFSTSTSGGQTVTVSQASSATAVTATPSPAGLNQTVTLNATVSVVSPGSGVPTGTVQFFDGSTSLGSATLNGSAFATLTTTFTTLGSHSITATYAGDAQFTTSTSLATTVPVLANSTTTVAASPTSPVFGQSTALTATVTASSGTTTPTGTVTFSIGSTTLGTGTLVNGVATITTSALAFGANAITASYSGDTNFVSNTSAATSVTVVQAGSTTTVTSSPASPSLGTTVTLTARVAAASPGSGTPTGTVQFFVGSTSIGTGTLSNGVATITTSTLSAGANAITATYQGNTNFTTSTSTATVNVGLIATTTTVTASRQTAIGGAVTLTATVTAASGTATPSGTIGFYANNTLIGTSALDASGVATFSATGLALGNTAITAVYSGDSTHSASTSDAATASVGTINQIFVNQVFLAALGRPADAKGLTFWTHLLNTQISRKTVVRGILNSPEGSRASVASIFKSIYGTSPTRGQVDTATHLGNPTALNITANILGSQTFYKTQGGGTIDGYIAAIGNLFLGSDLPAGATSYFRSELRSGVSTLRVAQQLLKSRLGVNAVVDSLYERYVGREADRTGLAFYGDRISEGMKPGQLAVNLLSSTEYLDIALSEVTSTDDSSTD